MLGPGRGLTGRAAALNNMGRYGEGAEEGRLALAAARQAAYPAGEAEALRILSFAAIGAGDQRQCRAAGAAGRAAPQRALAAGLSG